MRITYAGLFNGEKTFGKLGDPGVLKGRQLFGEEGTI